MDVIYWLIPLSIVVLILAVIILFWAVRSGQFQDLDSAASEILFDQDIPKNQATKEKENVPHQDN